ncbi:MAG: hypothetical protein OXJ90_01385 [Spirochaetaceae bacterium]|nr:hypothetical protein [Spirochaetaceae bacterium]
MGVAGQFPVWHRGSSVVVPQAEPARAEAMHDLATPATAYRILLEARAAGSGDVLSSMLGALLATRRSGTFKEAVIAALHGTDGGGRRRFSVATEIYGRVAVHRGQLAGAVDAAVKAAFPRWRRSPDAGARLLCKADPEYAVLALQTATNLSSDEGLRAGSLREHLAASLLTLAGTAPGCTVFDPFMGTGTILQVAARRFGAASCHGLEQSRQAFQLARQRLSDSRCRIFNTRFEEFDLDRLPAGARLVSNIPFGHRFARTPTAPLVALIGSSAFAGSRVALLMSREQAGEVAAATRLRVRNVLVLGQPAAIVYG